MRRLAALPLILLVAAADAAVPPGGKPVVSDRAADDVTRAVDEATRATDRLQVVGTCVSNHPPGGTDGLDGRAFADCECAAERVPAGRAGDSDAIEQAWRACRSEAAAPPAGKPPVADATADKPTGDAPAVEAEADKPGAGAGLFAWFGGLPRWAWVAIPALVVLLAMMLRRRDKRGDLVAPPREMRPDAVAASPRMNLPDDPAAP